MSSQLRDPSFRDCWLTPSDPSFAFKTEHLGFLEDMTLPILDDFGGENGTRSHAACIAAGLDQKRDREQGIIRVAEMDSGSFSTPVGSVTLTLNLEFKKELPFEGARWLFSRSRARKIKDGKMDNEVLILDEHGELVAIVQQVHQLVDLTKPQESIAKVSVTKLMAV